ncbi:DUF4350 domain-containing protein [Pedobacter sandarakinus]|uniref:DUF4350 domain-containing protein n=1 Tax=Pedobacter sandarakinus TaxID=353156 RepID=UPI0022453021|nr:DUF4350 domain-containing protein [Pedobacter sandarakinus]MCX2573470.1 DUF4350 domain-containing protein [Pedobacter sandarakinus]
MKGYKLYLGIGFILVAIYLVAQFNKPTPTNWAPTYLAEDKIPYGTYILSNRIIDIVPNARVSQSRKSVSDALQKRYLQTAYLVVAQKVDASKYEFSKMKIFMEAGNDIFIAAYDFGNMEKQLKLRPAVSFNSNQNTLNFTNPNLKTEASYGFERGIGSQYFSQIDYQKAIVLGVNASNQPNFLKYQFGKGALYLVAEPGFYTNFNLLDKYGAEYASKTLSYLQNNKAIILDQYFSGQKNEATDVLRVFFAHPELKWAYYLSIFGLFIFVIYDIKRRQRIIPILDPMTNSSLEFVNVVGSVYYQERNNKDIALKKVNYFLEYLRTRYFLKTNEIDRNFAQILMEKTGINEASAKTLTRYFIEIPLMESLGDHELINLNQSIENFYQTTQPNGARTV